MFDQQFSQMLRSQLGDSKADLLIENLGKDPKNSIRINPAKIVDNSILDNLSFDDEKTLSKDGFFLTKRGEYTLDPLFHSGAYYVQEASSMALELILPYLKEEQPLRALDLCAAPGGKSTHLLSILSSFPSSLLVSNEVIGSRATILAENVEKWGADNVVVSNSDPSEFKKIEDFFNLVVVDAPCSGEGMFRKDVNARQEWSADAVNLCAARQRRIVSDVWGSLKDGGIFVYSTCTFNRFENEDNVKWIVDQMGGELLLDKHFYPGDKGAGEGFYIAIIRKEGETTISSRNNDRQSKQKTKLIPYKMLSNWLKGDFIYFLKGDMLKGYRKDLIDDISYIESQVKVIRSGVAVATCKQAKNKADILIPEAGLALSQSFDKSSFPSYDLSLNEALNFLRREPLQIKEAPLGYLLITYKGVSLGFVKNIGNRSNNLWPQAWRIKNL